MSSSGLDAEEQQFQDEVAAIKQWWSEPRWRFTKRPFTAEQIANKRGNLTIQHPGNVLSKKLWDIVEKRYAVGSALQNREASVLTPR
jgi:isocitrate lyase